MFAAIISASAVVLAACVTIILTKRKEMEVAWRSKKLAYYEELLQAASGVVDRHDFDKDVRFAHAVNAVQLIASQDVVHALQLFLEEIKLTAIGRTKEHHDLLYSRLMWHIRADLGAEPTESIDAFQAFLWSPGSPPSRAQRSRNLGEESCA